MAKDDSDGEPNSRGKRDEPDDSDGFSFTLPPIRLPDVAFPTDVQVWLPPPGYDRERDVAPRTLLLVAVLVDLLDAGLLFVAGPPLLEGVRLVGGTALALVLVGLPGLLYVWEGVAVLAGVGWLSAFPSATALVLARLLR